MPERSDWPLPSRSRRVRLLLTLAEGTIIGAGLAFVVLGLVDVALWVAVGSPDPTLSLASVLFFGCVALFFLLRTTVFVGVGRRYAPDNPPEYRDWMEIRRWGRIVAVACFVSGGLLAAVGSAVGRGLGER